MEHLSIYLAGNIQKDHENKSQIYWTEEDRGIEGISSLMPI